MGQLSALGHSEAIGGWDATKTIEALHGYRDKERNSNHGFDQSIPAFVVIFILHFILLLEPSNYNLKPNLSALYQKDIILLSMSQNAVKLC